MFVYFFRQNIVLAAEEDKEASQRLALGLPMSNWGRPYFNDNQNYSYRPGEPSDHQWQYMPQSNSNSSAVVYNPNQNGNTEFYNSAFGPGPEGLQNSDISNTSSRSLTNSTPFNMGPSEINDDIWVKAAKSTLVPTAGEFIPSATYHQTSSNRYHGRCCINCFILLM